MISGNEILVTLVVILFNLLILETQLRKSFALEEVTLLNRIFISILEFYDTAID